MNILELRSTITRAIQLSAVIILFQAVFIPSLAVSQPDLIITSITASDATGPVISWSTTVKNQGNQAATANGVKLRMSIVDGSFVQDFATWLNQNGLAAGATYTFNITSDLTSIPKNGSQTSYKLRGYVDPDDQYDETNETNNKMDGPFISTVGDPVPTISSISPTSGVVGSSFVITGNNFGATKGSSTVKFGLTTASTTAWSNTSITATVPTVSTGALYTVGVQTSNGSGNASSGFLVLSATPAPTISSIAPTSGFVGSSVVITGSNFGATKGSSTVKFGTTTATTTVWGNTSITATVPSLTAGQSYDVIVTTAGGSKTAASKFNVLTPQTAVVLDQQNLLDGQLFGQGIGRFDDISGKGDLSGTKFDHQDAQTFVAGKTGTLEKIKLPIKDYIGKTTQGVILKLLKQNASSVPDENQSLGTVSLPASSFKSLDVYNATTWPEFNVAGLAIKVSSGDKLAFSVRTTDTSGYIYNPESTEGYGPGMGFRRNAAVTSVWTATSRDFGFQIYVRVISTSGVSNDEDSYIPGEFSLGQNYPNPFNPSTTMSVGLPEKSFVRLTVYNTLGQMISQVFSGTLEAGIREFSFNAASLSSGIYLYRMEVSSQVNPKNTIIRTKKMLLLR